MLAGRANDNNFKKMMKNLKYIDISDPKKAWKMAGQNRELEDGNAIDIDGLCGRVLLMFVGFPCWGGECNNQRQITARISSIKKRDKKIYISL